MVATEYTNQNRKEGENFGQSLAVAKVEGANVKIYGFQSHEDSDASDGCEGSDDEVDTQVVVTRMKWAQTLKVKFYSDRQHNNKIAGESTDPFTKFFLLPHTNVICI